MSQESLGSAGCITIDLEIPIESSRESVWSAIFDETEDWWLPAFRVAGAESKVTFDSKPGGRGLVEETPAGAGLQWFNVQMLQPQEFKVYLVGHIAPDWGGPQTSNLKLALEQSPHGCILKVSDSRHGNIDENQTQSYADGWMMLFTDGLKKHVESK